MGTPRETMEKKWEEGCGWAEELAATTVARHFGRRDIAARYQSWVRDLRLLQARLSDLVTYGDDGEDDDESDQLDLPGVDGLPCYVRADTSDCLPDHRRAECRMHCGVWPADLPPEPRSVDWRLACAQVLDVPPYDIETGEVLRDESVEWHRPACLGPAPEGGEPVGGDEAHCDDCGWSGAVGDLVAREEDDGLRRCPRCDGLAVTWPEELMPPGDDADDADGLAHCDDCGWTGPRGKAIKDRPEDAADPVYRCPECMMLFEVHPDVPAEDLEPAEDLPRRSYRHPNGKIIEVHSGLGGDIFMAMHQKPSGSWARFKSRNLGDHDTADEAQRELDAYAAAQRWTEIDPDGGVAALKPAKKRGGGWA